MNAETWIALAAVVVSGIVAVTVPRLTFRLALKQDEARWLREQRAQLYVDVMTEAYAEQLWFEYHLIPQRSREGIRLPADLRLKPFERAQLGCRMWIIGSREVNRRFNAIFPVMFDADLRSDEFPEYNQVISRVKFGEAMDALHAAIRREMSFDDARLAEVRRQPPGQALPGDTA
ncbi:hypothetical protein AB0H43_02025 [Hamadaea sp. NPDC050747]|uniref:hypothetical protein n=1 Tax=Hamadaea sp. NPDC050747 TaxID=3155789 RepID=UPI0033C44820